MTTAATTFEPGREIRVPDPPRIRGLKFRHYRGPGDHQGMVEANNTAKAAAGIIERVTVEGMANQYANLTNSDALRDVLIGEVDGRIVAYGRLEWGDNSDGARDYTSFCLVEPAVRRHGVGRAMLGWQESRIREIAATHVTDRPKFCLAFVHDRDPGGGALLSSAGYSMVRRSAEMVRPHLHDLPEAPLPDGIDVRPATAADSLAVWDAGAEAFRDHWGANDDSPEAYARFLGDPKFDPELWIVGWDGADVAGYVLTSLQPQEANGERVGYLDSVAVRRPWRRRGLGRALVAEALRVLRDRGATSAGLGVDLQNQNEAARLYESVGFEVSTTSTEFRKPLI